MTERRRRVLRWILAILVALLLVAGVAWRMATSVEVIETFPLSNKVYNIRFLKADVGKLSYTSDDKVREFLRPRAPNWLVKKLGDVTKISGYNAGKPEHGEPPLVLLFQLLTPQNTVQSNTTNVFERIEFPESTGFVFTDEIRGYSSHGQGTLFHNVGAFPRRDRTLKFRLFETGGKLLMEQSFSNPAYRSDFPVWTPEPLPATKKVDDLRVTLKSLKVEPKGHHVNPVFEVESDDASWLKPGANSTFTDATGNSGQWLSPYEPAWKVHLRLRRRRDAEFPASAIWKVEGLKVPSVYPDGFEFTDSKPGDIAKLGLPVELKVTHVDQSRVVDGIELRVRYVAPAAKIREEGGKITLSPPSSPGNSGMSTSAGSTGSGATTVRWSEVDVGMPYIRVEHDPLPAGVQLIFDVRDEDGVLLNGATLPAGMGGSNGVYFYAVYYAGRPETKTLNLEARVSRPRDVEFMVAPPVEMREAANAQSAK
ncbi:hypothetical protein AYO47_03655 [Planctomyces sp. SCGC AG-212-M04]|nr:hypothetical protein AYO47_03655 [Planctomyces sp. SCGC AG-212-M04]